MNTNIKTDCIFAKDNWQQNICNGCKALKDMYCKNEGFKCKFYKSRYQYDFNGEERK